MSTTRRAARADAARPGPGRPSRPRAALKTAVRILFDALDDPVPPLGPGARRRPGGRGADPGGAAPVRAQPRSAERAAAPGLLVEAAVRRSRSRPRRAAAPHSHAVDDGIEPVPGAEGGGSCCSWRQRFDGAGPRARRAAPPHGHVVDDSIEPVPGAGGRRYWLLVEAAVRRGRSPGAEGGAAARPCRRRRHRAGPGRGGRRPGVRPERRGAGGRSRTRKAPGAGRSPPSAGTTCRSPARKAPARPRSLQAAGHSPEHRRLWRVPHRPSAVIKEGTGGRPVRRKGGATRRSRGPGAARRKGGHAPAPRSGGAARLDGLDGEVGDAGAAVRARCPETKKPPPPRRFGGKGARESYETTPNATSVSGNGGSRRWPGTPPAGAAR